MVPPPTDEGAAAWAREVFSEENFDVALRRMRASGQAPGADGWLGVLARWAPRTVQLLYRDAVQDATMEQL